MENEEYEKTIYNAITSYRLEIFDWAGSYQEKYPTTEEKDNKLYKEQLSQLETKLRELFDKENTRIFCDTIEEKLKLNRILHKLGYKASRGNSYLNPDNAHYNNINYYTRPFLGTTDRIQYGKNSGFTLINYKDLLDIIGLDKLKNYKP